MGLRPDKLTLDRIDVAKGYEKSNCRWATIHEQRWNRRDMQCRAEERNAETAYWDEQEQAAAIENGAEHGEDD